MKVKLFKKKGILKLANLVLRGASLGAKFLFTLFLSKKISVEDYGEYNLLVTSITSLVFIVGLDFYSFTARKILAVSIDKRFTFIKNQFAFHFIVYLIFFPIIFFYGNQYFELKSFFLLLFLEHFSQEIYRIFVFQNKQLTANLLLLFRTFIWIVVLVVNASLFNFHTYDLATIVIYWIVGSSISILLGGVLLVKEFNIGGIDVWRLSDISFELIKNGLRICFPILLGTVSYKIIEYSDRFIIDYILGKKSVGIYSLYSNYSNIVNIIVNTTVTLIVFPKLVESVKKDKTDLFIKYRKKFRNEMILTTVISSILIVASIFPILNWIGKTEYILDLSSFYMLIAGNLFLNFSFVYHYSLYAYNQDLKNILPTVLAMLFNITFNIVFLNLFQDIVGAAIATTMSYMIIFVLKYKNWIFFQKQLNSGT